MSKLINRVSVAFAFCPMLAAQNGPGQSAMVAALIEEVHQLRLTIEQSTLVGVRTQIAMERIRIQEAHSAQAGQKLADLRKEIVRYKEIKSNFSSEQKAHEDELSQTSNPEQRSRLELRIRDLNRQLEDGSGEVELRGREGELASRMQSEQDTLAQLQSEMAQLISSLSRTGQQIDAQRKP